MNERKASNSDAKWNIPIMRIYSWFLLCGTVWVSWHNIPEVIDLDRSFTRAALGHPDPSQLFHFADSASEYGRALIHYHALFVALSFALPIAAVAAMFLRPMARGISLLVLFAISVGVMCFDGLAIISST